jgi:hypothetical protein
MAIVFFGEGRDDDDDGGSFSIASYGATEVIVVSQLLGASESWCVLGLG